MGARASVGWGGGGAIAKISIFLLCALLGRMGIGLKLSDIPYCQQNVRH